MNNTIDRGGRHYRTDTYNWKTEIEEIQSLAEKHKLTGREFGIAYELAMDKMEEKDKDNVPLLTDEIREVAKLIDNYTSQGLPLNEIGTLYSESLLKENDKKSFEQKIKMLNLTEREQETLQSILEQKRAGTLEILDKKTGTTIIEFKIPTDAKKEPDSVWYANLDTFFEKVISSSADLKIEMMFETE